MKTISRLSRTIGTRTAVTCAMLIYFVLVVLVHATGTTYYVSRTGSDSSPGTQSQPFSTIKKGLGVLRAGDTLFVRGGTYPEQVLEVYFGSSGTSWANPITVAGFPGEIVTLRPATSQGNVTRFQDGSVSYVVLDRLVFDGITTGVGQAGNASVLYTGVTSHHIRLSNSELTNGQGNGVLWYGSSHELLNCNTHNNGLYTGSPPANSNGVYGVTNNALIDGGAYWNNAAYGVRFFDSAAPPEYASNNIVRNARLYQNGYGIGLDGASGAISGGGGIVLGDVNNQAYNNLVYGNYSGLVAWGFSKYAQSCKFYNNTVYGNVHLGMEVMAPATNCSVINNIFFRNGTDTPSDSGTGSIISNNLTANPQFVNAPTDFSLQKISPAIDAGVTIASVANDLRGLPRPQGRAYDIGAYEMQQGITRPTGLSVSVR